MFRRLVTCPTSSLSFEVKYLLRLVFFSRHDLGNYLNYMDFECDCKTFRFIHLRHHDTVHPQTRSPLPNETSV